MLEHKYYVPFSARSFENAIAFGKCVEAGDFSHDYGVIMADKDNSIGWYIDQCYCISYAHGAGTRMEMPGLVLLEHFGQALALAQDPCHKFLWHASWVDNEFIPADELRATHGY